MILNTDIEFPFLQETELHTTLNPSILKVLRDIKSQLPNVDYADEYDAKAEKALWLVDHLGFSLYTTNEECDGFILLEDKEIYINENQIYTDDDRLYETISHEVGHIIQYNTGDYVIYNNRSLSGTVRLEQQCDAIATLLHSMVFGEKYQLCYYDESSVKFLRDWHGSYMENDIILSDDLDMSI